MKTYVVCMDSYYVRDAQMLDTSDLADEDFDNIDICSEEADGLYHDMEPNPFIAIVHAENEEEACKIAGEKCDYDPRVLFATEVK